MKRLGIFTIFAAALALGALIVAATAPSGGVQARDGSDCAMVKVAVDEGYGVSRTVEQRVCR